MDNNIKPGWKTTEFWLTLGTFIVTGFVLTGMLAPEREQTLINVISHSVESIAMVGAQAVMLCRYMNSRKDVKKAAIAADKTDREEKQPKPAPKKKVRKSNGTRAV